MGRIQSSWTQEGVVLCLRAFPWFALIHVLGRLLALLLPHGGGSIGRWPLRFHWAVEAVLLLEAAFLLYVTWRHRVLSKDRAPPPQLSPAELERVFERMLRHTEDMKVGG